MKAKYICINHPLTMGETIIIFPVSIDHKALAMSMLGLYPNIVTTIISAGFITQHNDELICYGESISLKLKSRPIEDSKLANIIFSDSI